MCGTAFFLGGQPTLNGPVSWVYLVTARHVLDGLLGRGDEKIYLRLNKDNGEQADWFEMEISAWSVCGDTAIDVAVTRLGIPAGRDHLIYPTSLACTEQLMADTEAGEGDEVIIVGLFRHHHGERRNIPIVRVGNLSLISPEPVQTKKYGAISAVLVEARSIGGLSGSPVFLNLGPTRSIGGNVKQRSSNHNELFGLIHGHFDVDHSSVDLSEAEPDASLVASRVNTGIAIVVPYASIQFVVDEDLAGRTEPVPKAEAPAS